MSPRIVILAIYLVAVCPVLAQMETIVTREPVAAGEPFQVQYVVQGPGHDDEFFTPDFKAFRIVSGPNTYTGSAVTRDGPRKLQNIVFTLVAPHAGRYLVPGASVRMGDKLIKSKDLLLEVIAQRSLMGHQHTAGQESNADYFLAPGEDPYEKIRRNLFMKVLVDKRSCFVGEPVTATFKLYSRLESKSDIVKNPGFYGFTVQDMVNLDTKMAGTETVNGKKYDVHVVRKVQLYPLQAGDYQIDPMEVRNKVEFSKSAVSKKTEQEIVEGVFQPAEDKPAVNTIAYESSMHTETIAIAVKAVPEKNKPADYNGATGLFTIRAFAEKSTVDRNEEDELVVTVMGKGNFPQLAAPVVDWPSGIDGFEPTVRDSVDNQQSPLQGKRVFRFRFVASKAGDYELPSIRLSFFNTDTNHYKTVATSPVTVHVSKQKKRAGLHEAQLSSGASSRAVPRWTWIITAVLAAVALLLFVWLRRQRSAVAQKAGPIQEVRSMVETVMQPAYTFVEADDKTFYNVLRNSIWTFLGEKFMLSGSSVNKAMLLQVLERQHVDKDFAMTVLKILDKCETGVYISVAESADRQSLLSETGEVLKAIEKQLN